MKLSKMFDTHVKWSVLFLLWNTVMDRENTSIFFSVRKFRDNSPLWKVFNFFINNYGLEINSKQKLILFFQKIRILSKILTYCFALVFVLGFGVYSAHDVIFYWDAQFSQFFEHQNIDSSLKLLLTLNQPNLVNIILQWIQENPRKSRISMTLVPYKVACLSAQVGPAPLTQCQSVYITRKSDLGLNNFQNLRKLAKLLLFTF